MVDYYHQGSDESVVRWHEGYGRGVSQRGGKRHGWLLQDKLNIIGLLGLDP